MNNQRSHSSSLTQIFSLIDGETVAAVVVLIPLKLYSKAERGGLTKGLYKWNKCWPWQTYIGIKKECAKPWVWLPDYHQGWDAIKVSKFIHWIICGCMLFVAFLTPSQLSTEGRYENVRLCQSDSVLERKYEIKSWELIPKTLE